MFALKRDFNERDLLEGGLMETTVVNLLHLC